jgi:glycosyltransferase involved in cell wall biosynthesis
MRTICFCNSNIPWGGGERWHLSAALGLAARGWRVLLVCHPQGELYKRASAHSEILVAPLPIGRFSFLDPFLRRRARRLLRAHSVQAVILNLPADLKAIGPVARSMGARHVIYRRGSALPIRDSLFNRYLFRRVITHCIVNSQATLRQLLTNNPGLIDASRVTLLPNGVDIAAFDANLEAAQSAPPLTPPAALVLGNAGRLNTQKGQHLLLALCDRAVRHGLDVRLVVAGEGEREQELRRLAESLGIADRVLFTGFMPDLSPFWNSIDVFVLTSLWEGFGYVLVEAMLARKPVFAFSASNIPELVREGPEANGRLFPLPLAERDHSPDPGPPPAPGSDPLDDMVAALAELIQNPETARQMGEHGRVFALRFSEYAVLDALEKLIE